MATAYFIDSSALVKRYVQETGTAWLRGVTRGRPSTVIYVGRITAVEIPCAIARRRKGRTLTPPHAASILGRFRQHVDGRYTVTEVRPDDPSVKPFVGDPGGQVLRQGANLLSCTAARKGAAQP